MNNKPLSTKQSLDSVYAFQRATEAKQAVTDSRNVASDWVEEKSAGWAGKDIHGCYTTDPKAVVSEAELKASCEAQLYGMDSRTVASGIHCEHGIVVGYCAECDGSTPDVAKFNAAVNPDDKYLADSCGKNNHTDSRTVARFTADINLDDPYEIDQFIAEHNTTKGRALANSLGFKGKDAERAANALSNYAWNKLTAISLRTKGDIVTGQKYEAICDRIYTQDIRPLINCW